MDLKEIFKRKQIEIYNQEVQLAEETQEVLQDLLSRLSDEQLAKIDISVDELTPAKRVTKNAIYIDDDVNEGEEIKIAFDDLTQQQLKSILDYVLMYVI